jgi:hypothetical protein
MILIAEGKSLNLIWKRDCQLLLQCTLASDFPPFVKAAGSLFERSIVHLGSEFCQFVFIPPWKHQSNTETLGRQEATKLK